MGAARQAADPREAERGGDRRVPPWLETEIALVKPRVLVCLGAVAAQALLGQELQGVRRARTFRGVDAAPRV